MVIKMTDYSKSIAFSNDTLNKLNSCLSKIGNGRLFFASHYSPKSFDMQMSCKLNFITMLLNISMLFYDCMPWFLKRDKPMHKNLGDLIKEITSIDYSEVKKCICNIHDLRNGICHNTTDYYVINGILDSQMGKKEDWGTFNPSDDEWEVFFKQLIGPIDDYFAKVYNELNMPEKNEKLTDKRWREIDTAWDELLTFYYTYDSSFINSIKSNVLPAVYDFEKEKHKGSDVSRKIHTNKEKQVSKWIKYDFKNDNLEKLIQKNPLCVLPPKNIMPEKYFFDLFSLSLHAPDGEEHSLRT